jgi:predicted nucleic acid-binding protein
VTILDAYAVIAYLRDEPAAADVAALLTEGGCDLTAVGLAEVTDRMIRLAAGDEHALALDLAELDLSRPVPVTARIAGTAGRLRAHHYHRRDRAVSLADCVAAQVARAHGRALATSDPHLLDLCRAEGIGTVVLPGSDGSRWEPAG